MAQKTLSIFDAQNIIKTEIKKQYDICEMVSCVDYQYYITNKSHTKQIAKFSITKNGKLKIAAKNYLLNDYNLNAIIHHINDDTFNLLT